MGCATGLQIDHKDGAVRTQRDPGATSVTSRDAARSGSDAALRGHRRTTCVAAATQPRDGCAAGMRNGRAQGALRPMCPRGGSSVCASASANVSRHPRRSQRSNGSTPRPAHAAGRRLSLWSRPSGERGSILPVRPLGGCSESEAQSYAAGPGFGGREPSRFLGTKRWKSQKLRQLSPEQPTGWKASEGVTGQPNVDCSQRFSTLFAGT